ncbi:hypothetical protein PCE1_003292 [Barthelona sp. PCE]
MKFNILCSGLILLVALVSACHAEKIGSFAVFTDVHLADKYHAGSDPKSLCIKGTGSAAYFGDTHCDAPIQLIDSAVEFAASLPDVNFYAFLGDILPQKATEKKEDLKFTRDQLEESIDKMGSVMRKHLAGRDVMLSLGNHDMVPLYHHNAKSTWLYSRVAHKYWQDFFHPNERDSFAKGAFYYRDFYKIGLRVIVINTNLYSSTNLPHVNKDVLGQWKWFQSLVEDCPFKILVLGHNPPGVMGNNDMPMMWAEGAKILMQNMNNKNIIGQIYGHLHTDTFIVGDTHGIWMTPAISPMDEEPLYSGNNPGIRVFHIGYTPKKGVHLMDYDQYYLDLSEYSVEESKAHWKHSYKWSDYGVSDMTISSVKKVLHKIKTNEETRNLFVERNTNGVPNKKMSKRIINQLVCAVEHWKWHIYYACLI